MLTRPAFDEVGIDEAERHVVVVVGQNFGAYAFDPDVDQLSQRLFGQELNAEVHNALGPILTTQLLASHCRAPA